jgi:hypothetical protein
MQWESSRSVVGERPPYGESRTTADPNTDQVRPRDLSSGWRDASDTPASTRTTRVVATALSAFLGCVLVLALLQLRGWNGLVNADGISYLDLAVQYAHGDFSAAANGYWSPLYPTLLGAAIALTRVPTVYLAEAAVTPELRVVFAVNALVLLFSTGLFARLLHLLDARDAAEVSPHVRGCRAIACAALWIWCAIRLIGTTTITPDVLLAGWLFLASAILVQASSEPPRRRRAAWLATALSLGYCTKAVFFPVMLIGSSAYLLSIPKVARRRHLPWLAAPVLVIAAPLVVVQSVSQGHLSFGETGRLNYAWYVNDMPHTPGRSELADVTRARDPEKSAAVRLTRVPKTILYAGAVGGTFPYWYDPSRFERESRTQVSLPALARVVGANLHWYKVVAGTFAVLCAIAIAAAIARQRIQPSRALAMTPAVTLLCLYLLTHPEGRLAGSAIVTTLALGLYLAGPRRISGIGKRSVLAAGECMALALLVILAVSRTSNRVSLQRSQHDTSPVAALTQLEIQPGARVGVIGSPYGLYWAHQSGVHFTVVREGDVPDSTPNGGQLEAMASESCARGAPLTAIVWRRHRPDSGNQDNASSNDWVVWKVPRQARDFCRGTGARQERG